ncbi:MAG: hypothetical protein ABIH82_06550 [Candidatus Woesearchaeota archaeon]
MINKRILIQICLIVGLVVLVVACNPKITSFDECVEAGNAIAESYPRQCQANGITYVESVKNDTDFDWDY